MCYAVESVVDHFYATRIIMVQFRDRAYIYVSKQTFYPKVIQIPSSAYTYETCNGIENVVGDRHSGYNGNYIVSKAHGRVE
jgi:hypothetical protein